MLKTIVTILYVIICIVLIVLVLMQEGKAGLSSTISGSSNSYWGKNKDNSIEGSIPKITGALAAIFIVLSVVLNVL